MNGPKGAESSRQFSIGKEGGLGGFWTLPCDPAPLTIDSRNIKVPHAVAHCNANILLVTAKIV